MPESLALLASKLQLAAIHLLRRVKQEDEASALSVAQLSVLNQLVRSGPLTISDLAAAERVQVPTMSRLVQRLERDGLILRITAADDRRVRWIEATRHAWVKLEESRAMRVLALVQGLARTTEEERRVLSQAADILERIVATPPTRPQ